MERTETEGQEDWGGDGDEDEAEDKDRNRETESESERRQTESAHKKWFTMEFHELRTFSNCLQCHGIQMRVLVAVWVWVWVWVYSPAESLATEVVKS